MILYRFHLFNDSPLVVQDVAAEVGVAVGTASSLNRTQEIAGQLIACL